MSLLLFCSLLQGVCWTQPVAEILARSYKTFEGDPQLRGSIASLYVMDANSGQTIFEKNGRIGLAPASTQKVITSASAYALLGPDFVYKTRFGLSELTGPGRGSIIIEPSGDPTLGSWRWKQTGEDRVLQRIVSAYTKAGIKSYSNILVNDTGWDDEAIPGGWIWQDIGNYYGAGAEALNWRENQYDLVLQSENALGSPVTIVRSKPKLHHTRLLSKARAAAKGTGDNAYIYFVPGTDTILVRGTIPVSQEKFLISGSFPSARRQFAAVLSEHLRVQNITSSLTSAAEGQGSKTFRLVHTELSPPLDSIIYWFNKKSINLYGEALVKTVGYKGKGAGTTDRGIEVVQDFWKTKGLESWELGMTDGSGLSPLNRVTTHAMVTVLHYARTQSWFKGFYHALPEYNGMKLKSGTISGVKGFCGFHKSRDGKEYIVAFLVNNYSGTSTQLVQKMYKVLDTLK